MKIGVIRLNHRIIRDKRVTSHVFLTARALGADFGILHGEDDPSILSSIKDVNSRWGGSFEVVFSNSVYSTINKYKDIGFKIVHLTFYGIPIQNKINDLKKIENLIIIIGGSKVPRAIYNIADYNISIGGQPHSEISSLAIFLHEFFQGKELEKNFDNAKLKVIPQEKGKKIINNEI